MTDEDVARVGPELDAGHAAVGVLTWDIETEALAGNSRSWVELPTPMKPETHEVDKLPAPRSLARGTAARPSRGRDGSRRVNMSQKAIGIASKPIELVRADGGLPFFCTLWSLIVSCMRAATRHSYVSDSPTRGQMTRRTLFAAPAVLGVSVRGVGVSHQRSATLVVVRVAYEQPCN
jgi:hypothetical protein